MLQTEGLLAVCEGHSLAESRLCSSPGEGGCWWSDLVYPVGGERAAGLEPHPWDSGAWAVVSKVAPRLVEADAAVCLGTSCVLGTQCGLG